MTQIPTRENRRILLVDDNEAIHHDFRDVLSPPADTSELDALEAAFFGQAPAVRRREPFEIDSAFQGQEALEKVRAAKKAQTPYALVFVDVRMPPGWDGIETLEKLWAEDPGIQAVICTAYADYRLDEIHARLEPSDRLLVLKKPFDPIEVRQLASALTAKWNLKRDVDSRMRALEASQIELKSLADENARLYEEAREHNRMKDEFFAVLSHELRTPLTSILGWGGLLQSGKLDDNGRARAVETIQRNARSQQQLVEDLLDISRIIAGNLRLVKAPVNAAAAIERAIDTVRPAAQAREVKLELSIDPGLPTIAADEDRLEQIAWNLLSNSIKFTPKGGRVCARVDCNETHFRLTVSDNGKGITSEFLPFVFDHFRQAESSSTRTFGGLGLGLSIVRHLVELHGGTVSAASEGSGKGSTFVVALPLNAMPSGTAEPLEPASAPLAEQRLDGLTILIVEDDADTRDLLRQILEQKGAAVIAAESAAKALDVLAISSPNVMVSDLGMPGEDGYSLIGKVRAGGGTKGTIPAIALTAWVKPEDRMKALSAGFQHFLPKPIKADALAQAISSAARHN